MPGNLLPNQMFNHEANVLKGWPHMHAVDKSAQIAEGEVIVAGQVCYLDANGQFRLGLPDNVHGMFAFPSSGDYDVNSDVGGIQSQVLMALPTIPCYELYTTEFDDSQNYSINDYLTAWDSQLTGYTAALKGMVRPGRPYHHTLVGQVSARVRENDFKKRVLSLWTYHLPIDLEARSSVV